MWAPGLECPPQGLLSPPSLLFRAHVLLAGGPALNEDRAACVSEMMGHLR